MQNTTSQGSASITPPGSVAVQSINSFYPPSLSISTTSLLRRNWMNSPELTTISWIVAPEGSSFDSAYAAVVKDGWALKA